MADRFVFEAVGEEVILQAIDRAIGGLAAPLPLYRVVGATLEENVNLRFQLKRDPNGKPWAPLSPLTPTLYWTIDPGRRGSLHRDETTGEYVIPPMPGSLLERTRRMLDSLASNPSDTGVFVGFSVPYAVYHETGTKKKTGEQLMPRRGMLMGDPEAGTLGDEDREDVVAEIDAYLARLLGA